MTAAGWKRMVTFAAPPLFILAAIGASILFFGFYDSSNVDVNASSICKIKPCLTAPRIVCRRPVYDFGVADRTQIVEHAFVVWNAGDAALEISCLRACCVARAEEGVRCTHLTICVGCNRHGVLIECVRLAGAGTRRLVIRRG